MPLPAAELGDYSIPPFCSNFTRTYAGTKDHLVDFMEALSRRRSAENFQPLLDAYPVGIDFTDFMRDIGGGG